MIFHIFNLTGENNQCFQIIHKVNVVELKKQQKYLQMLFL